MSLWGYFYQYTAGPSNHRFWAGRRKQEESYGLGPVHTSPQGVSSMWVIFNHADINQTVQSHEIQITALGDAWIVLRSLIRRDWSWAGQLKFQLYQNNSVGAKKRHVAIITQPLPTVLWSILNPHPSRSFTGICKLSSIESREIWSMIVTVSIFWARLTLLLSQPEHSATVAYTPKPC